VRQVSLRILFVEILDYLRRRRVHRAVEVPELSCALESRPKVLLDR
jgi:hypothetical protein